MSRGELSYSKIRALTRVATPENEEELLAFARCGSAAHVERLVRAWRRVDRLEDQEEERRRHASRSLEAYFDDDGMLVVRGRLDAEAGVVGEGPVPFIGVPGRHVALANTLADRPSPGPHLVIAPIREKERSDLVV